MSVSKVRRALRKAMYVGGAGVCRECGVQEGYVFHPHREHRLEHKPSCGLGRVESMLKELEAE